MLVDTATADSHLAPAAPTDAPQFSWDGDRATVECIRISELLPADSPRLTGQDVQHIQLLAATDAQLPPIVVHRATMRVIDGMHRLRAAGLRGHEHINVRFFDGSTEDAFVLGVQLNVGHGLPLTRADRTAAAKRIITAHPAWSDRLIASVSGLAAGTIRGLRRDCGDASTAVARIGRDGRVRPTDAAAGRIAASQFLAQHPAASLREIARIAGVSLATARDVRERVQHGQDPLPPMQRTHQRLLSAADTPEVEVPRPHKEPESFLPASCDGLPEVPDILRNLVRDPSLRFTENGRRLLRWLAQLSSTLPGWNELAPTVPSHSTYIVADLARKCATEWASFADELAKRTDLAS
ncbi:transcriptional regulator protein [Actinoplanes sp. N902-109]|nr:transcriptional regulator protein [Actinoplanes sp. N902-109]